MSPPGFLGVQIVVVALLVAAGAAMVVMSARRGKPVGVVTLAGTAITMAVFAVVLAVVSTVAGIRPFGMIRLLYLAGVVALPLVAAIVLAARARKQLEVTRAGTVVAVLALLAAPLGVYVSFVEPRRMVLETATVVAAPARTGREPVTLGVLADLQCDTIGAHEHASVDLLMAQKPDVILVPGDLFQGFDEEWTPCRDGLCGLLRRLDAPGGVFFVMGDTDDERTLEMLAETKIRVLRDEVVRVRVKDRDLTIGGVSWNPERVVPALERAPGAADFRILLCHRPDLVLDLAEGTRVDLVVAGHTHGGQIVVPLFGPPMTLSSVPRHVAAGGLHVLDGRRIYVSRGIGMERKQAPWMRFNCVPEVSVLTVTGGGVERP